VKHWLGLAILALAVLAMAFAGFAVGWPELLGLGAMVCFGVVLVTAGRRARLVRSPAPPTGSARIS
jgi:drug/metabolite transporter (DMT)-like permease